MDRMDKVRIFLALRSHDIKEPEDIIFNKTLMQGLSKEYEVAFWDRWHMREGALMLARREIQMAQVLVAEVSEHSFTVARNIDHALRHKKPVMIMAKMGGKPLSRCLTEAVILQEFSLAYYRDAAHAIELISAFVEDKRKKFHNVKMDPVATKQRLAEKAAT